MTWWQGFVAGANLQTRVAVAVLLVTVLWLSVQLLRRTLVGSERPSSLTLGSASSAWRARGGMGRNALAGFVATGADYSLFLSLISGFDVAAPLATFLGCGLGGLVNFTINRHWAFEARGSIVGVAGRYALASGAGAAVSALAVTALLLLPALGPDAAWLVARVWVFVTLNYPLHRDFVFAPRAAGELSGE